MVMRRENMISEIQKPNIVWDLVIIGGGASGLGAAVEAATRGMKTLLLEQDDFTKGTSSRSTKLVHGGVRYLSQGNISLVFQALRERGLMRQNAPHLVKTQSFIIPTYKWWLKLYYILGLTVYNLMAGRLGLGRSLAYSKKESLKYIPTLRKEHLTGGVVYYDGQFDDARYGINLCQTFVEYGGIAINYMKVIGLNKDGGKITGVSTVDEETGKRFDINAKRVINATGVFVDDIIKMDRPDSRDLICVSQGVHLVFDKMFLPKESAILIPKTVDGRILFVVPWYNKVVIGTTDVQKETAELEPRALDEEVDFILETAGRFLSAAPKRSDVKSVFAGLRSLAAPTKAGKKTKEISRGHKIYTSKSGLVTIVGGKWTTYRQIGEDVVDVVSKVLSFPIKKSVTRDLAIHGWKIKGDLNDALSFYGSDAENILALIEDDKDLASYLNQDLGIIKAQVVWAARNEMARTVEDVLARRTRALFLDAKESVRMAPEVAQILAKELDFDIKWEENQVEKFKVLASGYML